MICFISIGKIGRRLGRLDYVKYTYRLRDDGHFVQGEMRQYTFINPHIIALGIFMIVVLIFASPIISQLGR